MDTFDSNFEGGNQEPPRANTSKIDVRTVLLQRIAHTPAGLSISEIEACGIVPSTRRTLQRLLSRMVDEGALQTLGRGKGTRYFIGAQRPSAVGGYRHTLVVEYQPGKDYYLTSNTRRGFHAMNRALRASHAKALASSVEGLLMPVLSIYWATDLTWNSSRLTGVRYTEQEAEQFLESGNLAPNKPLHDAQVILNFKEACSYLQKPDTVVNEFTLCNLHAILTENLQSDPGGGGRLRSPARPLHPFDPKELLQVLVERVNAIDDPFEQSFFLLMHLSSLQLFEHGNMRLARMAANIPLLRADQCPLTYLYTPVAVYHHALQEVAAHLRFQVLHNFFSSAYEESCQYYASLPPPATIDPRRLRYHNELVCLVRRIVQSPMNREQVDAFFTSHCEALSELPSGFTKLVMEELSALHPGNIARYDVSLEQFQRWREKWGKWGQTPVI